MGKFKGIGINPELFPILIITFVLILGGAIILFSNLPGKFNFNYSKITIDGTNITEELHYKPNEPYHTLYRNFQDPVYSNHLLDLGKNNYIGINNVECSEGKAYFRTYSSQCYNNFEITGCDSYTENNEYGCTFGNTYGFVKDSTYTIKAKYEIHAENLFKIDNKYYIKFVVYSPNNHIRLTSKNFIVNSNLDIIKKNVYYPEENVIVYIPYSGDKSHFNIISKEDFEFDSRFRIKSLILYFFPAVFFFFLWFIFGRENVWEVIPRELSNAPLKRKYWEIAAYFNPPFSVADNNFFSAVMLDFYKRKIIDIKQKDKDIYIKLNKFNGDEVEKQVYDLIEAVKLSLNPEKHKKIIDGEYFNLKKAMPHLNTFQLQSDIKDLNKDLKEKGKPYLKKNIAIFILGWFFVLGTFFGGTIFNDYYLFMGFYIFTYIIIGILCRGALLTKFNGNYYIEYQKWRAFRRYLKNSFSIKTATHKTLVMWDEYLLYATALGVPKKVIEELKANNIITTKQADFYTGIVIGNSLGFTSAASSSGGGFGGAGGGGAGGGGGGGR